MNGKDLSEFQEDVNGLKVCSQNYLNLERKLNKQVYLILKCT